MAAVAEKIRHRQKYRYIKNQRGDTHHLIANQRAPSITFGRTQQHSTTKNTSEFDDFVVAVFYTRTQNYLQPAPPCRTEIASLSPPMQHVSHDVVSGLLGF